MSTNRKLRYLLFQSDISTGQKTDLTEQKFLWLVIVSDHHPKVILGPYTFS